VAVRLRRAKAREPVEWTGESDRTPRTWANGGHAALAATRLEAGPAFL